MAHILTMPKLGLTMTEGKVVKWLKNEGDPISKGDKVFDVETDKLTNTVESTVDGTLLKIIVANGGKVPCMTPVGIAGEPGEDISGILASPGTGAMTSSSSAPETEGAPAGAQGAVQGAAGQDAQAAAQTAAQTAGSAGSAPAAPQGRIVASPAAKKLAKEQGVDLATVVGTGPNGRITVEDVEAAHAAATAVPKASGLAKKIAADQGVDLAGIPAQGRIMAADVLAATQAVGAGAAGGIAASGGIATPGGIAAAGGIAAPAGIAAGAAPNAFEQREEILPMSGMRRIIAQRMRQSVDTSPTVTFDIHVDVTALKQLRTDLSSEGRKASYTDLLAYAVSRLLPAFPLLNCRVEGDTMVLRNYVNLGVAVALEDGLLVPVVTNAHLLSLAELSAQIKQLAESARNGSLSPDALVGGSFTITNLGMFGIESFTPIINQPEVAILGVNAITQTPVVIDDQVCVRPLMGLSLTTDHRAVDGSVAAQFLAQLKKLLEKPALLL